MDDYWKIQRRIASISAGLPNEPPDNQGQHVLRRCAVEAEALLSYPFGGPEDLAEQNTSQLQRILVDAAVRRFRAKRIYLRAAAAFRYMNSRKQIQQNQQSPQSDLQSVEREFRMEMASVTDARVESSLRVADTAAGKWLQEDPNLATLLHFANGSGK